MISGNKTAQIQVKSGYSSNGIGEKVSNWKEIQSITGWLDLAAEDTGRANYNTKIQESTHVFIADYRVLDDSVTVENSRMVIDGKVYEIMLIDNPMEMNRQLEIYLKYIGGQ